LLKSNLEKSMAASPTKKGDRKTEGWQRRGRGILLRLRSWLGEEAGGGRGEKAGRGKEAGHLSPNKELGKSLLIFLGSFLELTAL
jgi:hypothetical protein